MYRTVKPQAPLESSRLNRLNWLNLPGVPLLLRATLSLRAGHAGAFVECGKRGVWVG